MKIERHWESKKRQDNFHQVFKTKASEEMNNKLSTTLLLTIEFSCRNY